MDLLQHLPATFYGDFAQATLGHIVDQGLPTVATAFQKNQPLHPAEALLTHPEALFSQLRIATAHHTP